MSRETEPLLARRPSSQNSQNAADEDALLTGQRQPESSTSRSSARWRRLREVIAFIWAFLATIIIIVLAVLLQHSSHHPPRTPPSDDSASSHARPEGKRNLIFMVSDGMGPSSLSLARSFDQLVNGAPFNHTLLLDHLLIGQSRTRSSNSLVTDSAAGATAFSCGLKSYNGAISILPDGSACPSVMEAAKLAGYHTGVVVTTRVTDATPACFGSHVRIRELEDDIAVQLAGLEGVGGMGGVKSMDMILGGGRCHFLGNTTKGSCRADDKDVTKLAQDDGWNYIDSRDDFDALRTGDDVKLPLLGLFAPTDIPFEIDRRNLADIYPSLAEMTEFALRTMEDATADSDRGFFLMIEGSRIDHAGHFNDPAAQVHEVQSYDRAVRAVLDFIESSDVPTLMLATSDHETGGLSVARQDGRIYPEYNWYPKVLDNASRSAEAVAARYQAHLLDPDRPNNDKKLAKWLRTTVQEALGFDAHNMEIADLIDAPVYAVWILAEMISLRAGVGWSTHGHSAADVNIFSSASERSPVVEEKAKEPKWHGAVRRVLAGNRENTDVGRFLRWWLDVEKETEEVGKELKKGSKKAGTLKAKEGAKAVHREAMDGKLVEEFEAWREGRKRDRK
ncbi:alkaline phosphatase [Myriangium duriaei CBS 260.36]|uniref:Alkaline phosphatase n=1 Tax=Myriangium duriaei CBS 260.36 TaxID=1168546 RepID=A0A9P4J4R7_9PEZI|nr:alkaline phosphatase [Myriangium duriaei CBS 260.36]